MIELPPPTPPTGSFEPVRRWGDLLFVSGHAAWEDGAFIVGTLGADLDVAAGQRAARAAALCCLAAVQAELGDLDRIAQVIRVFGMIRSTPDFTAHPAVIDGCSNLLIDVFGARGRHARAAVGMASLPFGTAIELELTLAVG